MTREMHLYDKPCRRAAYSGAGPLPKYSLFYGRPGVREVGYDNERGKGDHRHFQGTETAYAFTSVEQLGADFWSDVVKKTLRGDN